MTQIFARVQELVDEGRLAAVATVVESHGSTPRKPGTRMIIYPDASIEGSVGGGSLEKRVIEEALRAIERGESRLVPIDLQEKSADGTGAICGGEVSVFIETVGNPSRLIVLGAGHVARALARLARELELRVVVYDDREAQTKPDDFPPGVQVVQGAFDSAMRRLEPTPRDFIAIMAYSHTLDQPLLKDALTTPARYIGMIGSKTKCGKVRQNLVEQGVSQERLESVHAPIGLPIGAHTPAEIAVSILAEIVGEMNA